MGFGTLVNAQGALGQEGIPKAIIQLDMPRVDVAYNLTGVNFATFTGSVILDMNESEEGYVELEADAGGWPLVISPRAFYVPPNTTSVNIIVEVNIPPEIDGGITQIMDIGGTIVTSEDNTTTHAIEPAQGTISVSPAYSVGIEFSQLYEKIPPATSTRFTATVFNYGSEGIFKVNVQNFGELKGIQWAVTVQPSVFHLGPGLSGVVNISVHLPSLWTLWTSRTYPIVLNVTTENSTFLENSTTFINVEGYFIGGFEWILCGSLIIVFFVLPVLAAISSSTLKGKEKRRLKAEKKLAKMEAKLRRKGILVPGEKDGPGKDIEGHITEPQPPRCPMCYSEDVKTLLLGKFKCRNCERLFEKEDNEPEGREVAKQGP